MLEILLVVLTVGWVSTYALYVFRTRGLRETNDYLSDENIDLVDRAIQAERAAAVAQTESQYLKQTLTQVLQRPAIAQMTDENIQQLGAIIQSIKPGMEN